MLPLPSTLTPHNQQAPTQHPYIFPPSRLLGLPSLPTPHRPIKRPRQLVKADRTRRKQTETYNRLSELKILCVCRDAEVSGILVDDAVLRSRIIGEYMCVDHSLDQQGEFWRHGGCL